MDIFFLGFFAQLVLMYAVILISDFTSASKSSRVIAVDTSMRDHMLSAVKKEEIKTLWKKAS